MADSESDRIEWVRGHHKQSEVAYNRPGYREARWERAIKVYTVNQESQYLLVQNVHALGVTRDLMELFSLYGDIEEYRLLDEYPSEPYTDVYWIKYVNINSARVAKRKLDNRSFFGKLLHVCYAPEYESVDETRNKLQLRRRVIAQKTRETCEDVQELVQANKSFSESKTSVSVSTGHSEPSRDILHQSHDFPSQSHDILHQSHDFPSQSHDIPHQSHDFPSQSHDIPHQSHDCHVPGLPPLPQLLLPPSETGTKEPSPVSTVELPSEVSQSRIKANPLSRKHDLKYQANGESFKSSCGHGDTYPGDSLFDPAGLSKQERMKAYMQTAEQDNVRGLAPSRNKEIDRTHTATGGHPLTAVGSTTYGAPLKSKPTSIQHVPAPTINTGNKSVNRSVQSIREQMNKVWDAPDIAVKPPKKRKRI